MENKARSKLEEVSVAENVFRVHVFLNGLEHPDAHVRDAVLHPLLPKFPNWREGEREKKKINTKKGEIGTPDCAAGCWEPINLVRVSE